MSLIRINRNPSRRELTVFGLIWLVFFGIIGLIVLRASQSTTAAGVIWTAAVVVPALGQLLPGFMRIVYLGMAYASFPIGFVVSYTILAAVYYLIITPIGLVMRLFGHDPMANRFDPDAQTYWLAREQDQDVNRYFRQF